MLRRSAPLLWIAGIAGSLWLVFPFGFPNYDTRYALVWGNELAHGVGPDYGAGPPTPHPLADLWGVLVSPLGADGASQATVVMAYLVLGLIAFLVYRLGADWFDRPIGALAAAILLTRTPLLANGFRAYVDLPYIALVLAALVVETRRPRAGWPVLALLAAAGLLRPEAWLFSAAYFVYVALELDRDRGRLRLRRRSDVDGREIAGLAALTASAAVTWVSFDAATTGNPLYSFTVTRNRVEALGRRSGPLELLLGGPHRLGEVMQRPGLIAAAAGIVFGLALLRRRSLTGMAAAALAAAAFALLACAGLAVIARYLMLLGALLCVFCAVALLGWRLLPGTDRWRRRWQLISAAIAVAFIVQAPQQYDYLSTERLSLEQQSTLESDLHQLAESGVFKPDCGPITVPTDRAVPRLADWLDLRPSAIVIAEEQRQRPDRGYLLDTRNAIGRLHFGAAHVPRAFRRVAGNDSWLLYANCR